MAEDSFVVRTGAGELAGWEHGTGPDLLLLHGGPGLSDMMAMLLPETVGWRAIGYQQRGVAPSTTEGPFTVARHVRDAVAVLDRAGVRRAVVAGHSWGGFLAMELAAAHPERVRGLVLIDALGAIGPDGGAFTLGAELQARLPAGARSRVRRLQRQAAVAADGSADGDEAVTEALALYWPAYFADPATAPAAPPGLRVSRACNAGTMATVFADLGNGACVGRLSAIGAPAVFVLGERSPFPRSQGEQTAALLRRAEVTVVPGGGHLPWHESPGCVAEALTRVRAMAGGAATAR